MVVISRHMREGFQMDIRVGRTVQLVSRNPHLPVGPSGAMITAIRQEGEHVIAHLLVFPPDVNPFHLSDVVNFESSDPHALGPETYFRMV